MNQTEELLDLLVESARTGSEPDAVPPPGFATALATRWASRPSSDDALIWARLSLVSLPFASAAALVCLFLWIGEKPAEMDELTLAELILQTEMRP